MSGFKPQEMTSLLSVNKETFRYWREQLDPNPHRAKFSASDILIYRLIKFLVHRGEVRVKTLKTCGIAELFNTIHSHAIGDLRQRFIMLDTDSHSIQFLPPNEQPAHFGFNIHYMPFEQVVTEHEKALLTFGE